MLTTTCSLLPLNHLPIGKKEDPKKQKETKRHKFYESKTRTMPVTVCLHTGHRGLTPCSTCWAQPTQQTRCPQCMNAARRLLNKHTTQSSPSGISAMSSTSSSINLSCLHVATHNKLCHVYSLLLCCATPP